MKKEATVDLTHVERIRRALSQHAGRPEVVEILSAIERAHEQVNAVLGGNDAGGTFEYSHLAWAKTQLSKPQDSLPLTAETRPTPTGALAGFGQYEEYDPRWLETLAEYLEHLGVEKPEFGADPQCIAMQDDTTLAIAGDWATGFFEKQASAASRIAELMSGADYTIHLGDTYYAGTKDQVRDNFVAGWKPGRKGSLALPGNHEMYTKGWPFMQALGEHFKAQCGTTFFAMRNAHWLVLALDSAYFAPHMYLGGTLGPEKYRHHLLGHEHPNRQLEFARAQLAARGARRVILFTHHPPFELADPERKRGLEAEVLGLFGPYGLKGGPDYWAWGHIHATAAYFDVPGRYRARLIGHGAIPYGEASSLAGCVQFYEWERAGDPLYPDRVWNGFLQLHLSGDRLTERLIAENGATRFSAPF